ncbi:hypothetical protein [Actinokineospora inagensis]|uniref:hypothetical protein n=1 Tax=Actinokineospora inagensis TaxID=103730 RepID=UPI0003F6C70A|nr:hypothetical protein [Actinokineospora inagensis]
MNPANPLSYDLDCPVALHPLAFLDEGDGQVTVGRAGTGPYGVFPADAAALLARLADGVPLGEAAAWYEREYGESVDVADFLAVLAELDVLLGAGESPVPPRPVRWRGLGALLFSPVAWFGYAGLVIAAVLAMVDHPDLRPNATQLFFTPSLVVVQLFLVFGGIPFVVLHEAFHVLAGRRIGVDSTIRLSRRFVYVVVETSLDGLAVVPRRRRYLPILAGTVVDVVSAAVLVLLADLLRDPQTGALGLLARLSLASAFLILLRIVWQVFLFLRTDLYYLIVTALRCVDLHEVAFAKLMTTLRRLLGRPASDVDESEWDPRDRAAARWYVWVLAAGYAAVVAGVFLAVVPATAHIAREIAARTAGHPSGLDLLDTTVFLALILGQLGLAAYLAVRARRATRPSLEA